MNRGQFKVTVIGGTKIKGPCSLAVAMETMRDRLPEQKVLFLKDWENNAVEFRLLCPEPFECSATLHQVTAEAPEWLKTYGTTKGSE
jgi:hypothetical protein